MIHTRRAAGDLELRIPKLPTGSFFPSLLERRRRIDQALFAVEQHDEWAAADRQCFSERSMALLVPDPDNEGQVATPELMTAGSEH